MVPDIKTVGVSPRADPPYRLGRRGERADLSQSGKRRYQTCDLTSAMAMDPRKTLVSHSTYLTGMPRSLRRTVGQAVKSDPQ